MTMAKSTTRMTTMTEECPDTGDLRVEQLRKLTFSQLDDLAKGLIASVESGMRVIRILEENTDIKTKMMRMGITTFINLIKEVSVAYEERVKEDIKKD